MHARQAERGWKLANSLVDLEPPNEVGLYLGRVHHARSVSVRSRDARAMAYDMEAFLKSRFDLDLEFPRMRTM